jgi:hypothetical protein
MIEFTQSPRQQHVIHEISELNLPLHEFKEKEIFPHIDFIQTGEYRTLFGALNTHPWLSCCMGGDTLQMEVYP